MGKLALCAGIEGGENSYQAITTGAAPYFVSRAPSDVVKVHESPIALQSKMATFLPLPTQSSQSPPSHPWDADKAYDAAPRACTGERRVSHQSVHDRAGRWASHPWDADKAYNAAPRACTGERRVSHQSVYDRAGRWGRADTAGHLCPESLPS